MGLTNKGETLTFSLHRIQLDDFRFQAYKQFQANYSQLCQNLFSK